MSYTSKDDERRAAWKAKQSPPLLPPAQPKPDGPAPTKPPAPAGSPWATSSRVVPSDWHRRRQRCLRVHGGICHLCLHAGADQADHLLNVARGGTHDDDNLRPIHGRPCPTCGVRCHDRKTQAEADEGRRLKGRRNPGVEPHPGAL